MNRRQMVRTIRRRTSWVFSGLGPRKLYNMAIGAFQFATKQERMVSWPVVVKIDISPVCNLRCTICVHADAHGNPALAQQDFRSAHRMTVEQFRRVVEEIGGRSNAVSLYTWGDPMTHPDLDRMARIARDAGLQVHISTNFSFALSDERIESIVASGLTHLSVCVDGLSQDKYQLTRVGGRIDWVLENLKRVTARKRELGAIYPIVEVQYIKFQHNLGEVEAARRLCQELGVDEFSAIPGGLHNYTDVDPGKFMIHGPKKNRRIPQCYWPHFGMTIKWNGDVLPCCTYRIGAQHTKTPSPDARVLGNVFEAGVWQVWNSLPYRQSRRLVSNPERELTEPELKQNFCHGCWIIYDTDAQSKWRMYDRYDYGELYQTTNARRPVPIRASMSSPAGSSDPSTS
jgi:MoaA/NifB/PqqE/SkfB family radical SAM enzyme